MISRIGVHMYKEGGGGFFADIISCFLIFIGYLTTGAEKGIEQTPAEPPLDPPLAFAIYYAWHHQYKLLQL